MKQLSKLGLEILKENKIIYRFSFKNFNQFKSNLWFKISISQIYKLNFKIINLIFKLTSTSTSTSHQQVLIQLPNLILLLQKIISILLKSNNSITQLINSRAFLPFALVIIASISKLFILSTITLNHVINLIPLIFKNLNDKVSSTYSSSTINILSNLLLTEFDYSSSKGFQSITETTTSSHSFIIIFNISIESPCGTNSIRGGIR